MDFVKKMFNSLWKALKMTSNGDESMTDQEHQELMRRYRSLTNLRPDTRLSSEAVDCVDAATDQFRKKLWNVADGIARRRKETPTRIIESDVKEALELLI